MDNRRRNFLRLGAAGLLAVAGTATGLLELPANAQATPASGDPEDGLPELGNDAKATLSNIEGPFHREGAPFRSKVTPPLEPGTVMVVRGRVWGLDTRKPIAGAKLDIWQANAKGRYDNDDEGKPPAKGVFKNRVRLVCDEQGRYEIETIHPGTYLNGASYRPSHIHFKVEAAGYRKLTTQLYFKGDPYQKDDPFIRESLIIKLDKVKVDAGEYEQGVFDIVLAKA